MNPDQFAFTLATAADAPTIADLRRSREEWMQAQGITQWKQGSLPLSLINEQVAAGEWWVLRDGPALAARNTQDAPSARNTQDAPPAQIGGGILAAGRLLDSDPEYWGEHPDADAPAVYVHGLMTAAAAAGRGLARVFLDYARIEAVRRGARWQRLDCRDHLLRVYEPMGFERVGKKTFTDDHVGFSGLGGYTVTLLQRAA